MQLRTNILEKLEEIINRNDDTVNGIIAQPIRSHGKKKGFRKKLGNWIRIIN